MQTRTVKSCCCGCTLRTGTLIILWLGVVSLVLGIILQIILVIPQVHDRLAGLALRLAVLFLPILLGIHVMAIYGVKKERPSYLKPYLLIKWMDMVYMIILMFGVPVIYPQLTDSSRDETEAMIGVEISIIIALGLTYYFFIVVLSFYKQLKGELPR